MFGMEQETTVIFGPMTCFVEIVAEIDRQYSPTKLESSIREKLNHAVTFV
jgi:hypothetical protein